VDRARQSFSDVAMVRIDAGFPSAALLAGLEARGIDYVSRLRANPVLDRLAEPFMQRPPGRRPAEPRSWLYELRYQADSWDKPRRVILVVKERADDLLLDRFFLVTSLGWTVKTRGEVLAHDRERGKAEGHMGEVKDVLAPALSSTNRARSHWRGKKPKSVTPAVDAFARHTRSGCLSPVSPARSCTSPAAFWRKPPGRAGACDVCASGCSGPVRGW